MRSAGGGNGRHSAPSSARSSRERSDGAGAAKIEAFVEAIPHVRPPVLSAA